MFPAPGTGATYSHSYFQSLELVEALVADVDGPGGYWPFQ